MAVAPVAPMISDAVSAYTRMYPPTHSQHYYGPEAGSRCSRCDNDQYRLQDLPSPSLGGAGLIRVGNVSFPVRDIHWICTACGQDTIVRSYSLVGTVTTGDNVACQPGPWGRGQISGRPFPRPVDIGPDADGRRRQLHCPLHSETFNRIIQVRDGQASATRDRILRSLGFPHPWLREGQSSSSQSCFSNPDTLSHFPMSDADFLAQQTSGDDPWLTQSGTSSTQDVADAPERQPRETTAKIPRISTGASPEGNPPRRCACPCAVKHTAQKQGGPQFCHGYALDGSDRCDMCKEHECSYPPHGVFGIPFDKLILLCKCTCPNCPKRDYFLEHNLSDAPLWANTLLGPSRSSNSAPDTEE